MSQHNAHGLILLVEDHAPLLRNMSFLLKVAGFEVITASDGQAALSELAHTTPDIIIADTHMPRMDGYELLQQVKSSLDGYNIPFILMSADYEYEDLMRGLELGASDYLPKPFDIYDVLDIIQRVAPNLVTGQRKAG